MKRLTEEEIHSLNKEISKRDYDQGVFKEPSCAPEFYKDQHLVYLRWHSAGRPGSCWDDSDTINEDWQEEMPTFYALELLLDKLGVKEEDRDIIEGMMEDGDDQTDYGYYGDYDTYSYRWIP